MLPQEGLIRASHKPQSDLTLTSDDKNTSLTQAPFKLQAGFSPVSKQSKIFETGLFALSTYKVLLAVVFQKLC